MNTDRTKKISRTGLLLAATLILQGLRLFLPMPPQISMFLIGALVNACLVIAVLHVGWRAGIVVACVTPVFAWLEGMLPFMPFIFPVAAGNTAFIMAIWILKKYGLPGVCGAAVIKAAAIYGAFYMLFGCVTFPGAVRHMILLVMSWPQIVTAIIGGLLGYVIIKRIQ